MKNKTRTRFVILDSDDGNNLIIYNGRATSNSTPRSLQQSKAWSLLTKVNYGQIVNLLRQTRHFRNIFQAIH